MTVLRLLLILTLLLRAGTTLLFSQDTRGSIRGLVRDSTGAMIPGATVAVTNVATNVTVSTTSNSEGVFFVPYLLPGGYRLNVEVSGFKTFVREGISLRISENIQIDIPMEVGSTTETLTVTAEAPLLETADASVGNITDERRTAQLPIAHGQPFRMIALSPGVMYVTNSLIYDRPYETNMITRYGMGGTPGGRNEITLDGSSSTTLMNRWHRGVVMAAYSPPADIVQEVKVQTVPYDASIGHTQGGITSVTLKSGGNRPHGTAYWSGRNPSLNAGQFFAQAAGLPKSDLDYNRWGATFTGPVYIPGIIDGRNKLFVSYAYEGIHEARPRGNIFTVPTQAEKYGDLSQLLSVGANYQIYDPATRVSLPNGRYGVQPFGNNIIPAGRISPIARNVLEYWPLPDIRGTVDNSNNLDRTNEPERAKYWNHIVRLDANLTDKDRFFVRANTYHRESHNGNYFHNAAGGCCHGFWTQRAAAVDNVHVFGPGTILDTRAAFTRHPLAVDAPEEAIGFDVGSLGFPAYYANAVGDKERRFPEFRFGMLNQGSASYWQPHQNINAEAILNLVRSRHKMSLGGGYRLYRTFGEAPGNTTTGRFDFDTNWTRGPFDNSAPSPRGQGLASILLGLPTGGWVDRFASFAEQNTVYSLFFQDDWRLTPRFTLNLGLRYELETPITERFDRSVRGFDFTTVSPLNDAVRAKYAQNPIPEVPLNSFRVAGGLAFAGVSGQPRGLWGRDTNNLMPRLGFALSLNNRTVLRGGYGIFYGPLGVSRIDVNQIGFSARTELVPSLDNGLTFVETLANPFPKILQPVGAADGINTFLGQAISFFNTAPKAPLQQRWSFGIQHELGSNVLLDVAYVGNHGSDLEVSTNFQSLPLDYLSRSPVRDQAHIDYMTQQVPNPFYPLLPRTNLAGQTMARADFIARSPYPQFTGMTSRDFNGYSNYHSLQTKVEKRFATGWTFGATYTWSKYLEAVSRLNGQYSPLEYVVSADDAPHRLALSGIWELPFGRGKALLGSASGVLNVIMGGWQLQGIYLRQSGTPIGFGNAAFLGNLQDIPMPRGERTPERWFNTDAGFVRDSRQQLAYNMQYMSTRFSGIRADYVNNWDLSILKDTKLSETMVLELRFEALNAFNRPLFAPPNTSPASSAFGRVTNQHNYSREVQFGARLRF